VQVITYSHAVPPKPAKERLLAAATRVFARDGLDGATTRAIAQEAGVNEVTLFRVFGSKKKLLAEVVACSFNEHSNNETVDVPTTDNLRNDLTGFVKIYQTKMIENIALIRTMIGDLQRHREHEVQVLKGIFLTLRTQMIARLKLARDEGEVRRTVDPAIAVDQLVGMVFTCVLKSTRSNTILEYPVEDYIAASIDLLINGITKGAKR
jgi:AcrR family transcriptional regulator